MSQEEIRVRGTVQGVGFRPTVYRLAKACQLTGDVCNDGQGVLIRVCGNSEAIEELVRRLQKECPPLASIETISRSPYPGDCTFDDFVIAQSLSGSVSTEIAPDAATCPQCQAETFDSRSRWYRYPFTNCTHCGPRLSIIQSIPYDRINTSMAAFVMCSDCAREYHDVENRRFHAQPIACPVCGPQVWLEQANGQVVDTSDPLDTVCILLQQGEIVAIKGLGGIHLACDATNERTVQKLRSRKQRYHKPLALMARDIAVIEQYCTLNPKERELLQSPVAPIVLLEKRGQGDKGTRGQGDKETRGQGDKGTRKNNFNSTSSNSSVISVTKSVATSVAPGQTTLGFMLPNTPLHHLILQQMDRPIVLTSGNLSDEPQCIDNQDARIKLGKIADYLLLHNRDIVNRVDDSVVRVINSKFKIQNSKFKIQILRRARGYAPAPIRLPAGFDSVPHILAMGSELKNTFCLLRDGQAILSQHLGDLENAAAFGAYRDTLNLYLGLFKHKPVAIAIDKHPEYLSTKLGKTLDATFLQEIQHHHAHIAACLAENGIPLDAPPVLGIALDGLGYGENGTLWGGEFLLADYRGFKRLATFKPVTMIGGEKAIYQPWRNTYAQLMAAFDWEELQQQYGDLELVRFLEQKPRQLLNQVIEKGINSPLASSAGRLFDGVAAALGICRQECSYEGQAAIEMEALIDADRLNQVEEVVPYPFGIGTLESRGEFLPFLEPRPMWQALLNDLQQTVSKAEIGAKFHSGLASAIAIIVDQLRPQTVSDRVVLTGGVFQNRILLAQVTNRLEAMGIEVLTHRLVPPNDGGISLGQAVIAAAQLI
ncbi:carbamoyltransferase HypF [Coleofasciculus sp. LEGE 07092]|nr:carbamoyltransferase HypF [Coleofasciculus sp. LEGE 07092]